MLETGNVDSAKGLGDFPAHYGICLFGQAPMLLTFL